MSHIDLVSLLVHDYDEAIAFYVDKAGFELVEDSPETSSVTGAPKRWVVVRPPGAQTGLLLARASDDAQRAAVGRQTGGRVGLFLHTEDFDAAYRRMTDAGIRFTQDPRQEPYGWVVVWEDLYGNRWDLLGPAGAAPRPAGYDDPHIGEVLFSQAQIAARVAELGRRITADYAGRTPLLVSVLKGSLVFMADLMRAIEGPAEIDVLAVSSYGAATKSSGVVRIIKDLDHDVAGRDVILVEDIVDSGLTMRYLVERLSSQGPASVSTCALLVREPAHGGQSEGAVVIDYEGFRLPASAFVIGYGLDAGQLYRNLPYVASYIPEP
ncbi:MAG: hypoxanthine phosphoribosyltransferase [Acidimicrobiales bacterium]